MLYIENLCLPIDRHLSARAFSTAACQHAYVITYVITFFEHRFATSNFLYCSYTSLSSCHIILRMRYKRTMLNQLSRLFSSFQTDLDYRCQKEFKWKMLTHPPLLLLLPLLSSAFVFSIIYFCCCYIQPWQTSRPTPYRPYLLSSLCLRAETTRILPPPPPPIVHCVSTARAAIVLLVLAITGGYIASISRSNLRSEM